MAPKKFTTKPSGQTAAGAAADAARYQAQANAVGANKSKGSRTTNEPKGPGTTVVTSKSTGATGSTGSVSVIPPVVDPTFLTQLEALRAENALLKSNAQAV